MRASDLRLGEAGNGLLTLMILAASIAGLVLGVATDDAAYSALEISQDGAASDDAQVSGVDDADGAVTEPAGELADDEVAATSGGDAGLPPTMISGFRDVLDGVYNDIFYMGNAATLTGKLLDNGFFFAQTVHVRDTVVDGDLLVFAQTTTIDGEVLGDVYSFNMALEITENAVIHGNVFTFAGMLTHEGVIHGVLHGGGGETFLNGSAGSVELECGKIEVGPATRVAGDLAYEAKEEAEISPDAVIGGDVRWNRPDPDDEEEDTAGGITAWGVGVWIWWYLAALLVGVVMLAVGGKVAREPAARLLQQPAQGLGFGFVVAVVMPVACLVAMITVVGLPLGVMGAMLYLIGVFVARLFAAQAVGTWILGRLRPGSVVNEYAAFAFGLLVYCLLVSIPYVGFLIWLAAAIAGLGGIFLALRRRGRTVDPTTPEAPPIVAPAEV